jgi:hypothetical protein
MAEAMLTVGEMVGATRCLSSAALLAVHLALQSLAIYLPWNLGLRFSLKARTPSRRSSVVTVLL